MEKKKNTSVREIVNITVIHAMLVIIAFKLPKVTLWISIALFLLLIIIPFILKQLYKIYLKKAFSSEEGEKSNNYYESKEWIQFAKSIFIVFCNFVINSLLLKLVYRLRFLALPSIVISAVALYRGFLKDNTLLFLNVIAIYIFLRLYIYYTLKVLDKSKKIETIIAVVKIILESMRIFALLLRVLGVDGYLDFLGFKLPSSFLDGIVATIAIDSILKEKERFAPKPKKEITAHET